jgi:NAD+ kinase
MKKSKVLIIPNISKEDAEKTVILSAEIMADFGAEVFCTEDLPGITYVSPQGLPALKADFIIAVGGDGTILKSCYKASEDDTPLLGINTGRLGFMASVEKTELELLQKLFTDEFTVDTRMMLSVSMQRGGEEILTTRALNEITVATVYSKIADFDVTVGDFALRTFRSEGLVIATPTGSTAYALACGGPIIEPHCSCIELTPLYAHSLFSRTMVFGDDRTVYISHKIKNNAAEHPEVFFSADGRERVTLLPDDILIIRKSERTLKLIDIKGNTFFCAVQEKLLQK